MHELNKAIDPVRPAMFKLERLWLGALPASPRSNRILGLDSFLTCQSRRGRRWRMTLRRGCGKAQSPLIKNSEFRQTAQASQVPRQPHRQGYLILNWPQLQTVLQLVPFPRLQANAAKLSPLG